MKTYHCSQHQFFVVVEELVDYNLVDTQWFDFVKAVGFQWLVVVKVDSQ